MLEMIREIDIRKIHPNKLNPRLEISIEHLNELAASIEEIGLLEPIIVRPSKGEFEVVVGERRYRASQQAGLEKIIAIVREFSDEEVVLLNLIENVQRDELNAIEKGKVCKYLLENCSDKYPSQSALARKVGVSVDAISLWLRATDVIPREAQEFVAPSTASRQIPEGKIDYLTAVRVGRSVKQRGKRVELIKKLAEKRFPSKERIQIVKKIAEEPDRSIEEVIDEVIETPYEMQFTAEDKKALLEGTKTQITSISMPNPKVKTGAIVQATIREPNVTSLLITSVERKRLKYFGEDDAKREGGHTLRQFKKTWIKAHGEWDESQLIYVVRFEKTE